MKTRLHRLGRVALFVAVTAFAAAGQAFAHARLLRAKPADKADLAQPPRQIELWFNELIDEGFNTINVIPAKEVRLKTRTNFAKDAPSVDAKDRTHVVVDLQPLPPGDYVVEWRVLSRDGHSAPGRFRFRVREAK